MRILIVDDSIMMRRIIAKEFADPEFDVFEAKDGFEAISQIKKIQPDLITMDVDMPKMNGYETVKKVYEDPNLCESTSGDKIPIIFITANDTIDGRSKGFEAGASEFITKPFLPGEVTTIAKALIKPENVLENRTVLIAEDSKVARNILNMIIKQEGFKTILAEDGAEAFRLIKKHQQDIDLIITDFMMPEMNGDELCQKVRNDLGNKTVPIIFLSGLTERNSILKIFKAGASDYVVKPFAKEELLARVRVHLKSMILTRKQTSQVKELKRLSKLKDDLLAITSHDLRAPLNGVLGFTDLLLDEGSLTDTQIEYLNHVKDSGTFLLSLINDILDLGKLQSENTELEKEVQSLDKVIASSTNTIRHMASPKNIELILESKLVQPANVMGNESALIRIFNNILSNAIKFTPVNGKINQIMELVERGTKVSISIIDNGIGIPEDKIKTLFSKYSKISRPGTAGEKGTGLGMSITKELVEQHDGIINVTSEVDKGTCFKLIFPLVIESKPTVEVSDINPKRHANDSTKILLVDDNYLNIKLATTVFEKNGFQVECATDGKQAKELYFSSIKSADEKFDLIFMDLQMPVLSGMESTRHIREYENNNQLTPVTIIAMTAASSDNEKEACKNAGMDDFVTKPISMIQIEKVLNRFINH